MGRTVTKRKSPAKPKTFPHVEKGNQYARDIVSGKILACDEVIQACQRHLDDLANTSLLWPYTFDPAKGERACKFLSLLPHVKGSQFVGQNFELGGWQCWIVSSLFSWVKKATGTRRFRKALIVVPKGNGKSFLASGMSLYMLACENEPGAEVYSLARVKQQARVVFDVAQQMARQCPKLQEQFGVEVSAHDIHLTHDKLSVMRPLASEADSLEGVNPFLALFDELHVLEDRTLYENIESALAKRNNNLLLSITTAGSNRNSICYEVLGHLRETLNKTFVDETLFGVNYSINPTTDWTQEDAWIMSNPNWGVSVDIETFVTDAKRAIFSTHKQASFQQKHLDLWTSADNALISARDWAACLDQSMDIETFHSDPCVVGLDLASKLDLAAQVQVFSRTIATKRHLYVFPKFWLPADTIEKSSHPQYEGWAKSEYITRSEGATNDFEAIQEEIKAMAGEFDVRAICVDPWNAHQLLTNLQKAGAPVMEIGHTVKNFSPALKELLALVAEKRIHHDGNPCMAWNISNLVGHRDANDNIFPRKEREESKIDGCIALIMSLCMVDSIKPKKAFFVVTSQ